jgi:hypothetical protein
MLDLHWNEEEQMYCDVGVNDDGIQALSSQMQRHIAEAAV